MAIDLYRRAESWHQRLSGIAGALSLQMQHRKMSRAVLQGWIRLLRRVADEMEEHTQSRGRRGK